MKQLRYGILSTSSIAPRFIAAVRAANAGQILALSSRTREKAEEKARLWNIPTAYGSHEALLKDPQINIIYISTINAQHYPWAKAALEHGKHVICEKPCTTSVSQTRELFRLATEKKLFFMEAQKMLFLPAVLELRKRIDAGELGQIHMAQLSHSFSPGYNDWMLSPGDGSGTLLSSGIYAVELVQWLFGSIAQISGTPVKLANGVECQYLLSGTTETGVQFSAKNSTLAILDNTCRVYGSKGWAELPEYWKARKLVLHMSDNEPEVLEFPCEHELIYEAQHIAQCFADGLLTSPVVTETLTVGGITALEQVKRNW